METYRRERTVSAFASSSAQQPGPPLPPPPPSNGAAALSHSGSALKNHAHEFRQRVKSDSARRPNLSSQLQQANLYLYNPREAVTGRPPLPPSQPPHKQNIPRARTRLQPQPSHETSQGFVSFNSFSLDNAGLPRPQPTAPQQTSRTPLKSSANASKSRPYALSGAPSVPQSLLEPLSIEPGYSIHKPEDTTNSQTYIQGNIKSIQTLASSLNRQTTISSDGARGHAQPEQNIATLSPQQCWYLLRTLVELEIEDECSKLWKLTGGLDADSVEWDSSIECLSEEQTTTEEMFREDPRVREVPILRWLLRLFLEMPLVNEAGHDLSPEGVDRRSLVRGMNLFWHAGLSPLLRSIHEMNLSHALDRGHDSFASEVSDVFTRGISRFIAAGLHFNEKEGPQEPTAQSTTLVDEQLSKSQNSGYLSNISESPDYSRLFFSSPPFSASTERLGPSHLAAYDQLDSPFVQRMAQPKLSTLHSGGSDVQSQRVSYNGSSDTPNASPEKLRLTLAQRFKREELELPPIPSTPDADDEAEEENEADEILETASDQTAELDKSKRFSSTSTAMFTAEEGFRTSADEERTVDLGKAHDASSSSDNDAVEEAGIEPTTTFKEAEMYDSMPPSSSKSASASSLNSEDNLIAWPSAPMHSPSFEPQDMTLTPKHHNKRAPPPGLNLAPTSNLGLSDPSPSPRDHRFDDSPSPSPQSTVKQSDKPRRRYFTLSFSRKRPPKNLKSTISPPILMHDGSSMNKLEVAPQTPCIGQQLFIDGEEDEVAPMEYHPDQFDSTAAIAQDLPPRSSPEGEILQSGHEWQWQVCQVTAPSYSRAVAWGGFTVDVVGVRESLFSGKSFILRVSRPSRLDEFVLRNVSDFEGLRTKLLKIFPNSYIRNLPGSKASKRDASKREKLTDVDDFASDPAYRQRRQSVSRFSVRLKEAARQPQAPPPELPYLDHPFTKRSSRRGTLSTLRSITPSEYSKPTRTFLGNTEVRIPKYNAQRRALRSWLSDTLAVQGLPHDTNVTTFLLSNPQQLSESDLKSMQDFQAVDDAHRAERRQKAEEALESCRLTHTLFDGLLHEIIEEDGLNAISEVLRSRSTLSTCPLRFQKTVDWLQTNLAQFLYDSLVATESTSFSKFKDYVSVIPWFMLRATLRLSNKPGLFRKAMSDLFLARPYGSSGSFLERILSVFLQETNTAEQLAACRARIGSISICEKIRQFVTASRDVKQTVRQHAQLYNIPLVVAIARGGEYPVLDQFDAERVVRASKRWEKLVKSSGATPTGSALKNDPHIRLISDMQMYLRILSEARDGQQIRQSLQSGILTEPVLVLLGPIFDLCIRLNSENHLTDFLGHVQRFCEQLITVVASLRARIQEPEKGVRILAKLLSKYRDSLYTFLHQVHLHDSIFDDLLAWLASAVSYLKSEESVLRQICLAGILPSSEEALQAFAQELDELVRYHRERRNLQQEQVFKQFAGDFTADDPITVQGDGYGRSRTEPVTITEPQKPYIGQISQCLARFRSCIAGFFDIQE